MRFHTGVFEAPTRRAISSSGMLGVLLQERKDVPVQIVEGGSHSCLCLNRRIPFARRADHSRNFPYLKRRIEQIQGKCPILRRDEPEASAMRHYPIFLDLRDRRVVVAGAGAIAVAKLRLLLKTRGAASGLRRAIRRRRCGAGPARAGSSSSSGRSRPRDAAGAALVYGANGDAAEDARVGGDRPGGRRARQHRRQPRGQRLHHARDRRPRPGDGGDRHRGRGAGAGAQDQGRGRGDAAGDARPAGPDRPGVPRPGRGARRRGAARGSGRGSTSSAARGRWPPARRRRATSSSGCWRRATRRGAGFVHLVGAGPGDPELLTLKARRLLHEADVVIHDRLVPAAILELARREATIVEVGKTGLRPVVEAGRHQRADGAARPRPARPWCG